MQNSMTRILGLWDSHYPFNISIKQFLEFAKDYQPDLFIFGGDNWSLDIISHWNDADFKNIGFDNIKKQLTTEATGFESMLDSIQKAVQTNAHKCTFVYIVGNHEDWIKQFTTKYPQMNELSLESLLGLRKRSIRVIPFGGTHTVGKLNFKHGQEFGTDNPAKQAVGRCHHSIVFGHHHSYSAWTDFSELNDREKHLGLSVPCYCPRAASYSKGRPNKWTSGFFVGNVKRSGNFSASVQLVDYKGDFITQLGKEYTSNGRS